MFSRILTSAAAVAASLGLLFYGMGTSYNPKDHGLMNLGLIFGIVGLIGLAIGLYLYRATEANEEAAARAKFGPDGR